MFAILKYLDPTCLMVTLMSDELRALERELLDEIALCRDLVSLDQVRVAVLGKKGRITGLMKSLHALSVDQKRQYGQALNQLKNRISQAVDDQKMRLEEAELTARIATEHLDVTLPARPETEGCIHPISQVMDEIVEIFATMGFSVAEGPDIEDDFHNFTALNIPAEHPARQMHDTFYLPPLEEGQDCQVLRTHTSPVQIRTMQNTKPPIRIIAPGRTYRCDSDATHTPMFHQVEALVIDQTTHMGHLKGVLLAFARAFFETDDIKIRMRPSYFPFTEPSAEVDIGCSWDGGTLTIGGGDDWLEILGSGMVHPNVLRAAGIDPDIYQGFALGMGMDRLAMLKYGIPDLRTFFDSDLRWLRHYGFSALNVPTLGGGLNR